MALPQKRLTLVVKQLLHPEQPRFISPSLQRIISRGCSVAGGGSFQQSAFHLFELPTEQPLPVAAVSGLAEELKTEKDYWLCADPVTLYVDHQSVFFLGDHDLGLSDIECEGLCNRLNKFLAEENLSLCFTNSRRWYLRCEKPARLITSAPEECIGKDIKDYLPKGSDQQRWRTLFTEIQMLLYADPVNEARRAQGSAEANALWFWGGGHIPTARPMTWTKVWSQDLLIRGLCLLTGAKAEDPNQSILNTISDLEMAGKYLLVLDRDDLNDWEPQCFQLLLQALKRKQLTELRLILGDGFVHTVKSSQVKRWFNW